MTASQPSFLQPTDTFPRRHIGPSRADQQDMLASIDCASVEELIDQTVPSGIRLNRELHMDEPLCEDDLLRKLRGWMDENQVLRSYIGQGYHGVITPGVIQRNILENPGWYTQYTPYQAEISQGRLEALLNFQTAVTDLTGLELANASLLDEATAAAEAMSVCYALLRGKRNRFFASDRCHPQTLAVLQTRAEAVGIEVEVGDAKALTADDLAGEQYFGLLLQYPDTDGSVDDWSALSSAAKASKTRVVVAADLLSLCLITPPGEWGADICVGSAQRFGVPMGFGGPHAAFMSASLDFKRLIPGRIIGLSKDRHGKPALRMALQTREQHIRRDKATSNICTAQVLLAIMAGMYAVYHGPVGLRDIAKRVHGMTKTLASGLKALGFELSNEQYFDTLRVHCEADALLAFASQRGINLRRLGAAHVGVALDETVRVADLQDLLEVFAKFADRPTPSIDQVCANQPNLNGEFEGTLARRSGYMSHPVFNDYHAEHEMLRYIKRLEARDLSLTTSMIPLGSCTMKLNATTEMVPLSWPTVANLHPFVPAEQAQGYRLLLEDLERMLCEITGFSAISFQPNAGSQGEYAGLLAIRGWQRARGHAHRTACLIPTSAHGTNPASAVMAGMRVVPVKCDENGNIDVDDLRAKAEQHAENLGALMVTYPSTHGVFEERIREICAIVHEHGGQVYMDGANMNAQVGLCRPGDFGADVCHLNLHKTFCIPHGGGGPGMGPIGVLDHLKPFLPGHPFDPAFGGESSSAELAIAAAAFGSPSILTISWAYIAMMGAVGLRRATEVAVLNANYMAKRLVEHYPVLYRGSHGRVAHEFILDLRPFEKSAHTTGEDVAKRLMDYGFHAPTMSFPVAGTLMIEPTESESRAELDRLCDALILIRAEIQQQVDAGPNEDNVLINAPHTAEEVTADEWSHPYSRSQAAFPAPWQNSANKFWPSVARIDNGYGDKNLICTCPSVEEVAEAAAELEGQLASS